jgi:hypothetical protein
MIRLGRRALRAASSPERPGRPFPSLEALSAPAAFLGDLATYREITIRRPAVRFHKSGEEWTAGATVPSTSVLPPGFDRAIHICFEREGVFSDDPRDKGGPTRFGISSAANPDVDLDALTREGAIKLLHDRYWDKFRCDQLPWPISLLLFDAVVQHGGDGAKGLQHVLGVGADGVVGWRTVAAVERMRVAGLLRELAASFLAFRVEHIYMGAAGWPTYSTGWLRRLFFVAFDTTP